MKRVIVNLGLLVFAMATVCLSSPGYSRGASVGSMGLIFSISLPKAEFEEGEAISLELSIKNGSKQGRTIPSVFVNEKDEPISVRSGMYLICQRGKTRVSFKGNYFKASEAGGDLKSGATHSAFQVDLRRCFDLRPGTYDVQLLFTARYSGFVDAASNRLTFTLKKKSVAEERPRRALPDEADSIDAIKTAVTAVKGAGFVNSAHFERWHRQVFAAWWCPYSGRDTSHVVAYYLDADKKKWIRFVKTGVHGSHDLSAEMPYGQESLIFRSAKGKEVLKYSVSKFFQKKGNKNAGQPPEPDK